jgi:uracil-DNA glycosylase
MFPNLAHNWQIILSEEVQKPYFQNLRQAVDIEYLNSICYPPKELLFAAFDYCSFENLKVVIIGQDPYHGVGEANGLCFSVSTGVNIPPSLRNIFRELANDLGTVFLPTSGNLEHWAKQGVLLLNASLSVQKDRPNSHKHLHWNVFTDAVIEIISNQKEGVVFLLWGSFAQKKGLKIDKNKHLVLQAGHPSPLSANKGLWFNKKHFSTTNLYLQSKGFYIINWNTDI